MSQDIIFSIVPEGKHARTVYLSADNGVIAAGTLNNKIFVDCSTIDTETSLFIGAELKRENPKSFFYDAMPIVARYM